MKGNCAERFAEDSEILLVDPSPPSIVTPSILRSKMSPLQSQKSNEKKSEFLRVDQRKLSFSNRKMRRHYSKTQIFKCASKGKIEVWESDQEFKSDDETVKIRDSPDEFISSNKKIKPSSFLVKNRRSKSKVYQNKENLKKFFKSQKSDMKRNLKNLKNLKILDKKIVRKSKRNNDKISNFSSDGIKLIDFSRRNSDPEAKGQKKLKRVLKLKKREMKEIEEKEREKDITIEISKLSVKRKKPNEKSNTSIFSQDQNNCRSKTTENQQNLIKKSKKTKKNELHDIIYKCTHPDQRVLSRSRDKDNPHLLSSHYRPIKSAFSNSKDSFKDSPINLHNRNKKSKKCLKGLKRSKVSNSHSSGVLTSRLQKHLEITSRINKNPFGKNYNRYSAKMKYKPKDKLLRDKSMGILDFSRIESQVGDSTTNYSQLLDWNVSLIKTNSKIRKENKELRTIIVSINKLLDSQLPENESKKDRYDTNDVLLNLTKVLAGYSHVRVELESQKNYISKIEEELRRMKTLSHYYPISSEHIIQEIGMSVEETEPSTSKADFSRSQNLNEIFENENFQNLSNSRNSLKNFNKELNPEKLGNAFKKTPLKVMSSASPDHRHHRRSVSRQNLQSSENFISEIKDFNMDLSINPSTKIIGSKVEIIMNPDFDIKIHKDNILRTIESEKNLKKKEQKNLHYSPQYEIQSKIKGEKRLIHDRRKLKNSNEEVRYQSPKAEDSSRNKESGRETYPPLIIQKSPHHSDIEKENVEFVGFGVEKIDENLKIKKIPGNFVLERKRSNMNSSSKKSGYSASFIDKNIENLREFSDMKGLDEEIKSYIEFVLKILKKECDKLMDGEKENINTMLELKSKLESKEQKYEKLKVFQILLNLF